MAPPHTSASRIGAIVAAGGTGSRFGRPEGKQLAPLGGRTVVAWSISTLARVPGVSVVVVAGDPDRVDEYRSHLDDWPAGAVELLFVPGGESRQESVATALEAVPRDCEIVLVHDGARPLVTTTLASDLVAALVEAPEVDGIVVGHPSVDTLKRVEDGRILYTVDRDTVWAVQTPQAFRAQVLREAHAEARRAGFVGTDEASLVERVGGTVLVFEGPRDNIKVTLAEDIAIAEAVLAARARGE